MASYVTCHRPCLRDFILTDKLGSGTYATVYKAYRKASYCCLITINCNDRQCRWTPVPAEWTESTIAVYCLEQRWSQKFYAICFCSALRTHCCCNVIFVKCCHSNDVARWVDICMQSCTAREVVAIKCIRKSSLNRVSSENLLTEIELLKTLQHEHIVGLKDFQVRTEGVLWCWKHKESGQLMYEQLSVKGHLKRRDNDMRGWVAFSPFKELPLPSGYDLMMYFVTWTISNEER